MYGRERAENVKKRISKSLENRSVSERTRRRISESQRGTELPSEVRGKISESLTGTVRSEETRRKMSESTAGDANPNWRGGYSNRYGSGWSVMRERIRERDKECQHCGHGGSDRRLEVHHIVPVRVFRSADELAIEDAHRAENLVLLCNRCHPRADHGAIEFEEPVEILFEAKR
nr:NUMOD3 domain-containing DNA-binding protein [Halorussus marinus]